jgi:hypothetical protein
MQLRHFIPTALLATSVALGFASLPSTTGITPTVPGALNPAVTQRNVCDASFRTSDIRPPTLVTNKIKWKLMSDQKIPLTESSKYELDHLVSLVLGGAPADPKNLWLQPYDVTYRNKPAGAREKDRLEMVLRAKVCTKELTLAEAQAQIRDWYTWYRKYGLDKQKVVGGPVPFDPDDNSI